MLGGCDGKCASLCTKYLVVMVMVLKRKALVGTEEL